MAKILNGIFPQETNWENWIIFNSGPGINKIFLYRLAAYTRDVVGHKITIGYGYRSTAQQIAAYNNYLAGGTLAAKPGNSWHEFGLAVDWNGVNTGRPDGFKQYDGTLNDDYWNFKHGVPETLHKYGITHSVDREPWHLQPIETKNFSGGRAWFADADDYLNTASGYRTFLLSVPHMKGYDVRELQKLLAVNPDGDFGVICDAAVRKVQAEGNLTIDGKAGPATFAYLRAIVSNEQEELAEAAAIAEAARLAEEKRLAEIAAALAAAEAARKAAAEAAAKLQYVTVNPFKKPYPFSLTSGALVRNNNGVRWIQWQMVYKAKLSIGKSGPKNDGVDGSSGPLFWTALRKLTISKGLGTGSIGSKTINMLASL